MQNKCKCGTNKNYLDCCGAYITNAKLPDTPDQLMRSRYTAYATCNVEYIENTMYGNALIGFDLKDTARWAKNIVWTNLKILNSSFESKDKGFVEFKAYYVESNQPGILHEKSEFQRKSGKWFYVDGIILS